MASYSDAEMELMVEFLRMTRECLARHTTRVLAMIAERDTERTAMPAADRDAAV